MSTNILHESRNLKKERAVYVLLGVGGPSHSGEAESWRFGWWGFFGGSEGRKSASVRWSILGVVAYRFPSNSCFCSLCLPFVFFLFQ